MQRVNNSVDIDNLQDRVVDTIFDIEQILGREILITSAYRSPDHPVEARKSSPGEHTEGLAIDVACATPIQFYELTAAAIKCGVKRIGISRKSGFIHLGFNNERPTSIWTY